MFFNRMCSNCIKMSVGWIQRKAANYATTFILQIVWCIVVQAMMFNEQEKWYNDAADQTLPINYSMYETDEWEVN